MALDQKQQNRLRMLGEEILRALETLVLEATQQLGPDPATTDVLAVDANPMTGASRGRQSIGQARTDTRRDLQRITREPFVARLDVAWTDDQPSRHRDALRYTWFGRRPHTCHYRCACGFLPGVTPDGLRSSLQESLLKSLSRTRSCK